MAKDNPGKDIGANIPDAVTDANYRSSSEAKIELGRLLMFDKILSGNENISCATCHHALTDTGDGLSLPVGEGGVGLGKSRNTQFGEAIHIPERVPRNAPPVFNFGAYEFKTLVHDGRVSVNDEFPSNCKTPAGLDLPDGLENVLACQVMFPVTSGTEMAGHFGENPIANSAAALIFPKYGVCLLCVCRIQTMWIYLYKSSTMSMLLLISAMSMQQMRLPHSKEQTGVRITVPSIAISVVTKKQ